VRFQFFLIFSLACLLASSFILNGQPQKGLPQIAAGIEPSTVVVITYGKEGLPKKAGGFFINSEGDVITNRHIFAGAVRAEVKSAGGKVYTVVRIEGDDPAGNIVCISTGIRPEGIKPLNVSGFLPVEGERVSVAGGLLPGKTFPEGIISAVRKIQGFGNVIQLAPPGFGGANGWPVLNKKGEVIGMADSLPVEGKPADFVIPWERIKGLSLQEDISFAGWISRKINVPSEEEFLAGIACVRTGNSRTALPHFEKAVAENPEYALTHFQIGYCNYRLGRYMKAVESFKRTIILKPSSAEAYMGMGLAYSGLSMNKEEIEAFKKAVTLKPDYAEAYFHLGWAYLVKGERFSALEVHKTLEKLDPELDKKLLEEFEKLIEHINY